MVWLPAEEYAEWPKHWPDLASNACYVTMTVAPQSKKLVVTATIPEDGAAVDNFDDEEAQVLVAVDATTKTAKGAAETNRYRTRIGLTRFDEASCLVYVDQVLVASSAREATDLVKVTQRRVRVELRKEGDTWKIDGLGPF